MHIIPPQNINNVTLLYSSITEADYAAWASGTTYTVGDRRILVSPSATVTFTIASPGVVTWTTHGLANGTPVMFTTTVTLPTGIAAGTVYYVRDATTSTFKLALKKDGAAISTTGSQSGTHTGTAQVHRIVESLQAGNVGNYPLISPTWWAIVGSTNRYAMFDQKVAAQSAAADSLTVVLQGVGSTNSISLLNIYADDVRFVQSDAAAERSFTITIASPGVATAVAHGFANGDKVTLRTTSALPTGLTALTGVYYIVNKAADTFQLSLTSGGAAINTSGTQSGTHYVAGVKYDSSYSLTLSPSTGQWDISTGSYASKSLSVAAQDATPSGVAFSSDGTKAYVLGFVTDTIYQYTLSVAWDISTGSYASKSLSVATQDTDPYGVAFSSDGTKAYMVGNATNTIYQYTLSEAWDISTGSYASKSLSVATQDTAPYRVVFSSDGTKAYVLGFVTDTIYQYTLPVAWDISTGSYASKSLSVATQDTAPIGVAFSSDGTKAYALGFVTDTIYQYNIGLGSAETESEHAELDMPSYTNARFMIVLTGTNKTVLCGELVIGTKLELGSTQYGARIGIKNYSVRRQDDWGNVETTRRLFSKKVTCLVLVENISLDYFVRVLESYKDDPLVWIGAEMYGSTHLLAYYLDFSFEIAYPNESLLSLELESLV